MQQLKLKDAKSAIIKSDTRCKPTIKLNINRLQQYKNAFTAKNKPLDRCNSVKHKIGKRY